MREFTVNDTLIYLRLIIPRHI